jgi:poly-gamma-glutamate capsule biosynthesis protein CapA/YwtB (metallophosphatase superfamily)
VAVIAAVGVMRDDDEQPAERDHQERAQPPPKQARSLSVNWVGDISLSSSAGLPADPATLFAGVKRPLRATDVTIGNLEGTLGSGGSSKCGGGSANCFAFQAPPAYARVFRGAGFDVMNLANNHGFDYGAAGQRQTIAALERAGIEYTGRPGEILVRRVRGLAIAAVGFAPYPWASQLRDIEEAQALVRRADRRADLVIVAMHAGAEGADQTHTPTGTEVAFGEDRGDTRGFAHAVIRAGADLVLGSGPHVVRGVERYRGRLIAYSLANFLGYHTFSTGGVLSLSGILRVRVSASGRPLGGRWISVRLDGAGVPDVDSSGEAARLVRSLSREDFGRSAYPMGTNGELQPAR